MVYNYSEAEAESVAFEIRISHLKRVDMICEAEMEVDNCDLLPSGLSTDYLCSEF